MAEPDFPSPLTSGCVEFINHPDIRFALPRVSVCWNQVILIARNRSLGNIIIK